jgi:hypothetical protein
LNWEAWLWCRLFKVSLQRDELRQDELQISHVPYREVACKGGAARMVHAIIKHYRRGMQGTFCSHVMRLKITFFTIVKPLRFFITVVKPLHGSRHK